MTNLRQIRQQKGYQTIVELAAKLDVSPCYISKIEREKVVPSFRFMIKAEKLLGDKMATIFPTATEEYINVYTKRVAKLRGEV